MEVFRLLAQRGPAGLPAGEIGARVGLPATTLSFHVSRLAHAARVTPRRQGRSIVYTADYAAMQALMDFLLRSCCQESGCRPRAPLRKKRTTS